MTYENWIKVEDELPPIGMHVLVTRCDDRGYTTLEVRRRCRDSHWLASNCQITAWQPLPEAYREKEI